jgi:phytoene dehydrogenase-like protein
LERREIAGGAAVTETFTPGVSRLAILLRDEHPASTHHSGSGVEPRFGFEVLPANDLFCPLGEDDDYVVFSDDMKKTQEQFARFSQSRCARSIRSSRSYLEESRKCRASAVVRDAGGSGTARAGRASSASASLLWRHRTIGDRAYRMVDLLTQSAYDYLSAWFEHDTVKSVLAYYACIGTFAGPKSPGTAYVIMHHLMGEHQGAGGWGFMRGGMGAITTAIARSAARFDMQIMTGAPVAEVLVADGRARGVRTEDGREFQAKVIVSNVAAPVLFRRLLAPEHLPPELLRDIDSFRTFSTAFKMNIAAHEPPRYRAFDAARQGFRTRPMCTWLPGSTTSSAPTMMPSTAGSRASRFSPRSCRA